MLPCAAAAQVPNPQFTWRGAADPGVTYFSGRYYVASTGNADGGSGPISSSADLRSWSPSGHVFPNGTAPEWIEKDPDGVRRIAAPQLYYLNSIGKYVVIYNALSAETGKFCIGRAVSSTPYSFVNEGIAGEGKTNSAPADAALECQDGGAYSIIDASLFFDPKAAGGGQLYLLYKRELSDRAKDIVIRRIGTDARTGLGPPVQLIETNPQPSWEGTSVEAPTMILRGGSYYLFYSGANFGRNSYAVGVAVSSVDSNRPDSKLVKFFGNPILQAGGGFCGVGHQDVTDVPGHGPLLF